MEYVDVGTRMDYNYYHYLLLLLYYYYHYYYHRCH